MAEEKDIALLADNDIIVEIELQETPTVVIETTSTTTAEISGDSAIGIVVGAIPTLAKEKTLTDGISSIKDKFNDIKIDLTPVAKEATLLAKVAELKEALNSIDFTAIEQAIQDVEDVTAREATLIQGVGDIIKAVENIDFTDLENSIAEVKDAVANIDFSALAKEETLLIESQVIQSAIQNIDLSSVESKVEEVGSKIDNIDLTPIENKVQEGVNTLSSKIDNIDLSPVAKQGENQEATNSAILVELLKLNGTYAEQIHNIIGE